MSALGDDIRDIAVQLNSIATSVDSLSSGGGSPTIPTGVDCLGGTWPPSGLSYPISYPAGDVDNNSVSLGYYDRKMAHCPDGTILVLGDSIVQDMVAFKIHPFAECFGYGGESFRRLMNRMDRGGLIHRAGATVILSGINDLANFTGNGVLSNHVARTNLEYMHQFLAGAATGKWVICDILPVDETHLAASNSDYNGMNAEIASTNTLIHGAWASSAADVEFVDVKASLIDGSGNLADANHIDGMHLSRAGHDIATAGINAALTALSI